MREAIERDRDRERERQSFDFDAAAKCQLSDIADLDLEAAAKYRNCRKNVLYAQEFDENRTRNVQSRGDNVNHSSNSSTTKTQVKYSN